MEYLTKEFGIDKDFDKYPLVEVRISNINKIGSISPSYIYKIGNSSDVVGDWVDEVTFSLHAKIRLRKGKK